MNLPFPKSIKTNLLIITFIVAFPAMCIIVYSGIQYRAEALDDALKDTQKLADRIATEQQSLIVGAEQLMTALAQLPDVKLQNRSTVEPVLQKLHKLNPMYQNLLIAGRDGTVWASAVAAKTPVNVADRYYFKNALASGQLSSGEFLISRTTSRPGFNLAYPVQDDLGRVTGVITVGFNIDRYRDLVGRMHLLTGTSFVLCDHNGKILSRAIDPEKYIGRPYPAELFRQMKEAPDTFTTIRTGVSGDHRIISQRKLRLPTEKEPYLYITAGIPVEIALQDANRTLVKNVALLFSFLCVAFAGAWFIGKRSITDRITLLESASRQLAGGDLDIKVAEIVAGGELGRLGESFDHMAHQLALREQALLNSQQRLKSLVANAPVVIFALDGEGVFTFSEGRGLESLGVRPSEAVGESVFRLYGDSPSTLAGVRRALAGETFNSVATIGEKVFEIWYNPVPGSGGLFGTIGVAIDITDRRRAEEEQEKLVTLVQMSRDFIGFASLEGRITYLNDAALALVGLDTLEEAQSRTIYDFAPEGALQQGGADLLPQLLARQYWRGESCLRHFKTGELIEVEMTAFTIRDRQDRPVCLATVTRDITALKKSEAERAKLEGQLLQVQRLESIGRLAGGVAHDFNNLLTPIMGYAELLLLSLVPGTVEAKRVASIKEAADKARVLTQQLLSFGRKQLLEMKVVDPNLVVTSFYDILRRTIRENIDIRLCLTKDTYGIKADRNQLEQIIMNLAINAQDAIQGKGVITIETAPVTMDDEYVRQHAVVKAGRYLMLVVTDSGCGMGVETIAHIFEPFYTTKGVGEGTGLGLATVYGLVKQHEGYIWLYSEIGRGSTFKIYFPIVEGMPVAEEQKAVEQLVIDGRDRRVLLVEDNEMVRTLVYNLLINLGFTVAVADGPKQALWMSMDQQIDLLVTDVVMPDMTGPELHKKIIRTHPHIKVLFMSGYTNNVIVNNGVLDQGLNFIQKPFAINDLARKIEVILKSA